MKQAGGRRVGGCLMKDIYNKRIKLDFFLSFYMGRIISFGYINMGPTEKVNHSWEMPIL